MYRGQQVHFFGFRGYEYVSAVRVWVYQTLYILFMTEGHT